MSNVNEPDSLKDIVSSQSDLQYKYNELEARCVAKDAELKDTQEQLRLARMEIVRKDQEFAQQSAVLQQKREKIAQLKFNASANQRDREWLRNSMDNLIREEEREKRSENPNTMFATIHFGAIGVEIRLDSPGRSSPEHGSPVRATIVHKRARDEGAVSAVSAISAKDGSNGVEVAEVATGVSACYEEPPIKRKINF